MNTLKILRKKRKLTQREVAEEIGITPGYYSMIEVGKRRANLEIAKKLAQKFEKRIEEIFID